MRAKFEEYAVPIRTIQHYLYCPHRWGLMEIGNVWAENYFVTKSNLLHERVHSADASHTAKGKLVLNSIYIYNDSPEYNIYGKTDCLEAAPSKDGAPLFGGTQKYKLCLVEYKPTKPKNADYHYEDLMQVFAQKLCVDYIFGCDCEGALYYANVKKRYKLPLNENFAEYDTALRKALAEMREYFSKGEIPPISKVSVPEAPTHGCSGCSLKDICVPAFKAPGDIRKTIRASLRQETGG